MEKEIRSAEEGLSDETLPRVRRPRPAWQEFFLLLCTFTLYASFWMVGQVRDLKSVGKRDFTPWLWFFVPMIILAQVAGLPRFFRDLTRLEDGTTNSAWKTFTWLWITILVIASLIYYVEDRLALPSWTLFLGFFIIAGLFSLLHHRINTWKNKLKNVEFYGLASGYTWYEWLIVSLGGTVIILGFYMMVIAPLFIDKVRDLDDQQIIENTELGFTLMISGEGWAEVSSGTHSGDETELELSGPILSSFFIVFDHGISYSINDVARFRAQLRDDFSGTPRCSENRILSKNETSVISFTECNGAALGEKVTTYSTVIKSDDRVLELYGYLSGTKYTHNRESKNMEIIAREFSPL